MARQAEQRVQVMGVGHKGGPFDKVALQGDGLEPKLDEMVGKPPQDTLLKRSKVVP